MERVCSLYYLSGNKKAGLICKNWAQWVKDTVRVSNGEVVHATNLIWSGNPDDWKSSNFNKSNLNSSLHGTVSAEGTDLGTVASLMKALLWVSMKDDDNEALQFIDYVMQTIENYRDEIGYSLTEAREDYINFNQETYIPSGWTGKNAQGGIIKSGATFIDIRPKYEKDPDWCQVEDYINGGTPPTFNYHRFWAQTEIMVTNGLLAIYDAGTPCCAPPPKNQCSPIIEKLGYSCCKSGCKVIFEDDDGNWGIENDEWCGCGLGPKCNRRALALGYPCCSGCHTIYSDEDGDWGMEDDLWCSIPKTCY